MPSARDTLVEGKISSNRAGPDCFLWCVKQSEKFPEPGRSLSPLKLGQSEAFRMIKAAPELDHLRADHAFSRNPGYLL